jgi:7,8-dihydropterin-6-yl-methyl-4-(beta-D-ribofuranosyl)aminobenzene 5'-phosphate synthase
MIIKTLVENTAISEEYGSEHGLSLYIETKKHKLLFDLGASGLFSENAKKMGVDLSDIDLVVISHGHYDHGAGLRLFLSINSKAKIYLSHEAFGRHYSVRPSGEKVYIGLDQDLVGNERFVFTGEHFVIDDEMKLFSNIKSVGLNPSGNQGLLKGEGNSYVQDDFGHEQNLIIRENNVELLLAGCAHKGIINIIDHFAELGRNFPTHVIGGFHLYNYSKDKCEDPELVSQIGSYLKKTDSMYYTCHCTGKEAYGYLKEIMGDRICYLSTGSQLII